VPDIPSHVRASFGALKFRGARVEELRTLSDAQWKDLLSRWDFVRFTVPMRQVCKDFLPDWVRTQIDHDIAKNAGRFERIKAEYSAIAGALGEADADHLVLKGFTHWPGYVEHPRFRRQSDIDIYCPPDSIDRAQSALSGLGYEPVDWVEPGPSDHLPPLIRKSDWKWRADFFDPGMPIAVELHFRLWDRQSSHVGPKDLDAFWFRRVVRKLDDISFPSLNSVDGLGYFSLHVLRDLLRGALRTYNLYELARFLHSNADNETFWQSWLELHDPSVRSLEAIPFRLAAHLFGCRIAEPAQKEIECLPSAVRVWFERYGDSPLTAEFRPNKDLVWLHLSLIESARDQREVLFRKLFPRRITPLDAPYIQEATEAEAASEHSAFGKRARHIAYVASRTAYHVRILPRSLWNGVRWWLSTKDLSEGFWLFFAGCFFFDFGMYVFFLLYNLFLLDRGFKENFLGLMTSATSIGAIVGTIPAGMFAQRFGLRKALLLCLTAVPLIFALRSLLSGEAWLLALSFLGGGAITIWAVCISPAIAQLTSTQSRPFGFSLIFSSGIAVGILGGQTGGHLPGWLAHVGPVVTALRAKQMALLIACALMALATVPISRLRFVSPPAQDKKFYPRSPFLVRYLAVIALWSLAVGAFSPFFNVYFSQHLRMQVKEIGTVYSISHISQVIAMLAAPVILRKFGLVTGIMYTQVAAALALGCMASVPGASTATVIYITYVAFQWMAEPGMLTLLMNQVRPSEQTGASAMNSLVVNVAQAIAAAVAGASFVRFGYPAVLSVIAGVGLVAACLFRVLLGKDPVPVSKPSPAGLEA
jgi:predicted MFS family arabinose efflux permease